MGRFVLLHVAACAVLTGIAVLAASSSDLFEAENSPAVERELILFTHAVANQSHWFMVGINISDGQTRQFLRVVRPNAPSMCAFALIDSQTVAFYGSSQQALQLEYWSLKTGKKISNETIRDTLLQSLDYNPASRQLEGVCQLWVPDQNMSELCWCAMQGANATKVHQMPTDFFGEVRDDCTGYLDPKTTNFWFAAANFDNTNRFLAGMPTSSSSTEYDWVWFGAINGSAAYDAYVHDDVLNRSFAIQLGPDNTTSQLVEIMPGIEPYSKDNPPPKVMHRFAFNFGLSAAGLAAYDSSTHYMFAIMERHSSTSQSSDDLFASEKATTQYLVRINVLSLMITFQEIKWPNGHTLSPGSMRLLIT